MCVYTPRRVLHIDTYLYASVDSVVCNGPLLAAMYISGIAVKLVIIIGVEPASSAAGVAATGFAGFSCAGCAVAGTPSVVTRLKESTNLGAWWLHVASCGFNLHHHSPCSNFKMVNSIVILSENTSRVSQAQATSGSSPPVSKDLGGHTKFRARKATNAKLIPRKTCFLRMRMLMSCLRFGWRAGDL